MAKYVKIGAVLKKKDFAQSKQTYIKIDKDVTLKAGSYVNVDDPRTKADRMEGKVSEDLLAKIREQSERIPDYVLFELTVKQDE